MVNIFFKFLFENMKRAERESDLLLSSRFQLKRPLFQVSLPSFKIGFLIFSPQNFRY